MSRFVMSCAAALIGKDNGLLAVEGLRVQHADDAADSTDERGSEREPDPQSGQANLV